MSLGSKNPNISLNVCKYSTKKTYSTRDIGTQTVRKCYSESSTLLPDYKKTFMSPSGIEPATDVLCHNFSSRSSNLITSSYCQVRILHTRYVTKYSFMLSASTAVTTVLACTQMILKFNGKVKSQL